MLGVSHKCTRGGNEHKYEPRYDDVWPNELSWFQFERAERGEIEAFKNRQYVRDVCVRCGDTIERT